MLHDEEGFSVFCLCVVCIFFRFWDLVCLSKHLSDCEGLDLDLFGCWLLGMCGFLGFVGPIGVFRAVFYLHFLGFVARRSPLVLVLLRFMRAFGLALVVARLNLITLRHGSTFRQ